MRLASGHLSYCTNIHPGETWPEVAAQLNGPVAAVRQRFPEHERFAVGLRLSAQAAGELQAESALNALKHSLAERGQYVVSLNGFPYGNFHGGPVKERVYLPDWRDTQRLSYTEQLARVLSAVLPAGEIGSISTVPGAFKASCQGVADEEQMARNLIRHALFLHELQQDTGKQLVLALEPEPLCLLETVEETVRFFSDRVWNRENCSKVAHDLGLPSADHGEALLRKYLGVCFDACHSAVEFEEPLAAIETLESAGIRIAKLQISAAIRLDPRAPSQLDALRAYAEGVYLHQVIARPVATGEDTAAPLLRFADLDAALSSPRALAAAEWRVHFHVPIYRAELALFQSTQPQLQALLERQRVCPFSEHLEVETYTFDVLPAAERDIPVVESIARELRWALRHL